LKLLLGLEEEGEMSIKSVELEGGGGKKDELLLLLLL
jgi:hypothetical protein